MKFIIKFSCGVISLTFAQIANGSWLWPTYIKKETICNNTGHAVNDVHLSFTKPVSWAMTQPYNTSYITGSTGDLDPAQTEVDINFSPTIPASGKLWIIHQSAYGGCKIDSLDPGYWTYNGTNVGTVTVDPLFFSFEINPATLLGDVYVTNPDNFSVQILDLDLSFGIAAQYFNETFDSDDAFASGTSALSNYSNLSPTWDSQGRLLLVQNYDFSVVDFNTEFCGGRVSFENNDLGTTCYSAVGTAIPEPATFILSAPWAILFLSSRRRRQTVEHRPA